MFYEQYSDDVSDSFQVVEICSHRITNKNKKLISNLYLLLANLCKQKDYRYFWSPIFVSVVGLGCLPSKDFLSLDNRRRLGNSLLNVSVLTEALNEMRERDYVQ
jgi:hypothetical protein